MDVSILTVDFDVSLIAHDYHLCIDIRVPINAHKGKGSLALAVGQEEMEWAGIGQKF